MTVSFKKTNIQMKYKGNYYRQLIFILRPTASRVLHFF